MLSDARRGEAYPVLREWASAEETRHHWRCGLYLWPFGFWPSGTAPINTPGSSGLDLGERSFYLFVIPLPLPVGRRLREGTGQRVQYAQPCQRREIIELVDHASVEAP